MKGKLFFAGVCFVLCGLFASEFQSEAEELVEQTAHITDPEFEGVLEEMVGSIIETRSTAYVIDWSVPAGRIYTTAYFEKKKGTSIGIGIELSKTGKEGIMDMDGNVRYVSGKSLYHTFDITKSYYYCIIVPNQSTSTITAKGYYRK